MIINNDFGEKRVNNYLSFSFHCLWTSFEHSLVIFLTLLQHLKATVESQRQIKRRNLSPPLFSGTNQYNSSTVQCGFRAAALQSPACLQKLQSEWVHLLDKGWNHWSSSSQYKLKENVFHVRLVDHQPRVGQRVGEEMGPPLVFPKCLFFFFFFFFGSLCKFHSSCGLGWVRASLDEELRRKWIYNFQDESAKNEGSFYFFFSQSHGDWRTGSGKKKSFSIYPWEEAC